MNTQDINQMAVRLLPDEIEAQFNIDAKVVSQSSVAILFNERNKELVSSIFSDRMDYAGIQNYLFQFVTISNDISLEKEDSFIGSAFCVLVLDADMLLRECEQKVIQYIGSHAARKSQLIILILNTNKQPSKTAIELVVEPSLKQQGLSSPIIMTDDYSQEELYDRIVSYFKQNKPDLDAINAEIVKDTNAEIRKCLETLQSVKEKELDVINKQWVDFQENRELFTTFLNQLPLDLWLQLKRYYHEHLEKDIKIFAEDARNAISEELKTIDIKTIMPYFGLYLNYLWGQFLNNEMASAAENLTETINVKLNTLLEQYRSFFNEDVRILGFKVDDIVQAGNLPISLDSPDEYNRVLQKVMERILNVFKWYSIFSGGLGDLLYSWFCDFVFGKFGNMLLIRRSEDELRRIYSDAVYHQFQDQEGLDEIKKQVQDVFIPALEKEFKFTIDNIAKKFNENLQKIEDGYIARISDLKTEVQTINEHINSI